MVREKLERVRMQRGARGLEGSSAPTLLLYEHMLYRAFRLAQSSVAALELLSAC